MRYFILLIAAFAFTMTSMVPKGFMRAVDGQGKMAIVICSGAIQKTIYIDQEQVPDEGNTDEQQPADSCPATIVSHQQLLTPVATLFLPLLRSYESFNESLNGAVIQQAINIEQSRAPPFFA
jgi:hypothetical protein